MCSAEHIVNYCLFSSRNIAPNRMIYYIARTITIFFRAIPEFIMAMIIVIAVGFGALPGVLALGFHTMGFLAKFYASLPICFTPEDPIFTNASEICCEVYPHFSADSSNTASIETIRRHFSHLPHG